MEARVAKRVGEICHSTFFVSSCSFFFRGFFFFFFLVFEVLEEEEGKGGIVEFEPRLKKSVD